MGFAPFAAIILLAFPALAATQGPAAEVPDGCAQQGEQFVCEWRTNQEDWVAAHAAEPSEVADSGYVEFAMPAHARSLATISVEMTGQNAGWYYEIRERGAGLERTVLYRQVPENSPDRSRHRDTSVHYFEVDPANETFLLFRASGSKTAPSVGEFVIRYFGDRVLDGVAPSRPAAVQEDPNLADLTGDAAYAWLDATAFWFDDAALDDGLFDAHFAVADLTLPSAADDRPRYFFWEARFEVQGISYILRWDVTADCATRAGSSPCLYRDTDFRDRPIECELNRRDADGELSHLTVPTCTMDLEDHVLHAVLPEQAVGAPGPGALFERIRLVTAMVQHEDMPEELAARSNAELGLTTVDEASGERYPFEFGGPAQWSIHNPRLDPPVPAWYTRPLAAENVADTIQIVGAFFAVGAFVGGLLLVARRRRRVHALLAEVDAIVREHRRDARRGLLALGDLEESLDARLASRRVSESEYQIVSQRIATAATRLAMRRDLGLDDGEPDVEVRAH